MPSDFFIRRTETALDLPLPQYMTGLSSGMDLYANVAEPNVLKKGEIKLIPAGIQIAMPKGYEAQIRPRSGLALKHGITMVNSPGTVDADYRGEICLIIINLGAEDFVIERGMRIAQMVICRIEQIKFVEVSELSETERGTGGFGHSGI